MAHVKIKLKIYSTTGGLSLQSCTGLNSAVSSLAGSSYLELLRMREQPPRSSAGIGAASFTIVNRPLNSVTSVIIVYLAP